MGLFTTISWGRAKKGLCQARVKSSSLQWWRNQAGSLRVSSCHCGDTRLVTGVFLGESPCPSGTGCVPNPACVVGDVQRVGRAGQLPGLLSPPTGNSRTCDPSQKPPRVPEMEDGSICSSHYPCQHSQGQSILLRPPLVNTGNLQHPYNAIKWNEDMRQSGAVSPAMWAGAGPGFLLLCSQALRFYGQRFILKSNQH